MQYPSENLVLASRRVQLECGAERRTQLTQLTPRTTRMLRQYATGRR